MAMASARFKDRVTVDVFSSDDVLKTAILRYDRYTVYRKPQ
jgi:hypothetical protein